ncbi:RraA family protein [Aestuariivirga sp.]|uniref:RraA family protein n=1 Tax=Aestuariivirga sp. TaxID=2650926 RepID=UPI0039E3DB45
MSIAHQRVSAIRMQPGDGATTRPKSAEMTPGPGFRVKMEIERPDPRLVASFRDFETPDISDILNRMYTMTPEIRNVVNAEMLVGPALTVKVFPGDNLMVHKALDAAKPGDVVVIDTSGSQRNAVLGDLITNKAKHRGIAGFIVDGLVRDLPGLQDAGLPVFARGITPFGPLHRGPGELNYAVSCGGIVVNPGDVIVADQSGIAVIRREMAEDTLMRLRAHRARMMQYVADVKAGRFSNEWVDRQLQADQCLVE